MHTSAYLKQWLKYHGYTVTDLKQAYHRVTGEKVTIKVMLKDGPKTWSYCLLSRARGPLKYHGR